MGLEWQIAFCSSTEWPFTLLKPGYQHVLAVQKIFDGKLWHVVDPNMSHLNIYLASTEEHQSIESLAGMSCTVIDVVQDIDNNRINSTLGYNTCVDTIKRLLGIKNVFIQTPYQLFKYLEVRHGLG